MIRALAAFLALLEPLSVASAQTPVPVELDAPFVHEGSGITVPVTIGRFERVSVDDFREDQLNIAIQLREESHDTFATIYIYRAALPDVSVWAERATAAILNNSSLGTLSDDSFFRGRFTPPNKSGEDSGFHARAVLEGKGLKTTAVSMFAHDDWIVKVRASSKTLSEDQITKLTGDIITGLSFEPSEVTYPPIVFFEECTKSLKFATSAKFQQLDMTGQILIGGLIAGINLEEKAAPDEDKPWCLDPQSTAEYSILHKDTKSSDTLIALSDSGVAAFVTDVQMSNELARFKGYLVKTSDGITEEAWPLLNKRPDPRLILQNYGRVSPIATRDLRPGAEGGSTINVSMPEEGS